MEHVTHTSKLTRRNQTTLPSQVRKALGIKGSDTIEYVIKDDKVILSKYIESEHRDEVVESFLSFLEADLKARPKNIRPITKTWQSEVNELVGHIEVDLDAEI